MWSRYLQNSQIDDPVFYPLPVRTTDLLRDIPGRYTEPVSNIVFVAFHPSPGLFSPDIYWKYVVEVELSKLTYVED